MTFLDDWKEWSTAKKAISIIGVCCIGIIIIGLIIGSASHDKNTSPKSTISVSDLAISSGGYGGYEVSCKVVPDKDYKYLEEQVIFYDSSGAVIDKSPLVWNMNDVHANQTIKANGHAYISGDNSPAKAKVLFFDKSLSSQESDAIYTQEVTL